MDKRKELGACVSEPKGRRTVRRLFIKITTSGGSAPAPHYKQMASRMHLATVRPAVAYVTHRAERALSLLTILLGQL
jgi:hypothetical protein